MWAYRFNQKKMPVSWKHMEYYIFSIPTSFYKIGFNWVFLLLIYYLLIIIDFLYTSTNIEYFFVRFFLFLFFSSDFRVILLPIKYFVYWIVHNIWVPFFYDSTSINNEFIQFQFRWTDGNGFFIYYFDFPFKAIHIF